MKDLKACISWGIAVHMAIQYNCLQPNSVIRSEGFIFCNFIEPRFNTDI